MNARLIFDKRNEPRTTFHLAGPGIDGRAYQADEADASKLGDEPRDFVVCFDGKPVGMLKGAVLAATPDHRVYDAQVKKASDKLLCASAVKQLIEARSLVMAAMDVLREFGCERQAALKAAGLSSVTETHGPCGCQRGCATIVTRTVMQFELAGGMDIGIEWVKNAEVKA
jgi:hypothetical protein